MNTDTKTATEQLPVNVVILKPCEAAGLEFGGLYIMRAGKVRHWSSHPDFDHSFVIVARSFLAVIGVEDSERYLCVRRADEEAYLSLRKHLHDQIEALGYQKAFLWWEAECLAVGSADADSPARDQEGGAAIRRRGGLDDVAGVDADGGAPTGYEDEL